MAIVAEWECVAVNSDSEEWGLLREIDKYVHNREADRGEREEWSCH